MLIVMMTLMMMVMVIVMMLVRRKDGDVTDNENVNDGCDRDNNDDG